MTELKKGSFCRSKAGHDVGTVYIVVDLNDSIKVADGKFKRLENPKVKNPKHLEKIDYEDKALAEKFIAGGLNNEAIKYSIKKYLINANKGQEVINV